MFQLLLMGSTEVLAEMVLGSFLQESREHSKLMARILNLLRAGYIVLVVAQRSTAIMAGGIVLKSFLQESKHSKLISRVLKLPRAG